MLQKFLSIQQNVRLYHWTTDIYTQHVVSGELYEKLDKLFDRFIETYQGQENRLTFKKITVESVSLKLDDLLLQLEKYKKYLMTLKLKEDLSNIRDEIVAEIHKYMFLLRLK